MQQQSTGEHLAHTRVTLRVIELEKIEERLDEIASLPTVKTPAIPQVTRELPLESIVEAKPTHKPSRPTRPILPLDELGRGYVKLRDPLLSLLELAEAAIARYYHVQKCYPSVIRLCATRFIERKRLDAYYTENGQERIPYELASYADFDVMVR